MSPAATTLALEGRLASGLGEGATFTSLDWVARAFEYTLGYVPYPGTVNLVVTGDAWERARASLHQAAGMRIAPPPGFCAAKCFTVMVNGDLEGAIVLPEVSDYPADKLEFVAPVPVRQALNLIDGDRVTLQVMLA